MNIFYRISVAIYSLISTALFALIMILPFGDKVIMGALLEYVDINFYQSNTYDVMIFIVGLVLLLISIAVLTSGLSGRKVNKYITKDVNGGSIRISTNSIENVALAMSRRFQGVKDSKARVIFRNDAVDVTIRLHVFTDVNVPALCSSIQARVKESIENSMEIKVSSVVVNVDSVSAEE